MLAVPDLCHFNWRFNNSNQGEKRSEWLFNNREFLEKGLLFYLYAKLFPILSMYGGPCVRVEVVRPRFAAETVVSKIESRDLAAKQDYAIRPLIIRHRVCPTPAGMYDRVHVRPHIRVEVLRPCLGSPGTAEQDHPV